MANLKYVGVGQQMVAQVLGQNGNKIKPFLKQHSSETPVFPKNSHSIKSLSGADKTPK